MSSDEQITQLDLQDFIESLYNELPKELQTKSVKTNLAIAANDIIMEEITDYMSAEDLEDNLKMNQEMGIPLENIMQTYIESNPELLENITDALNQYSQFIINFSTND